MTGTQFDINDKTNTVCESLKVKGRDILTKIESIDSRFSTLNGQAMNIINALQKLERTKYSNITFVSLLEPLDLWFDILNESYNAKRWSGEQKDRKFQNSVYKDSCTFLNSINLFAQNSIRTDKQFVQAVDFDIHVYDIPVKLNVFYNAFACEIKDFLNSSCYQVNSRRYEFFICPSLTDTMNVCELFYGVSGDKRLFIIHLPEKQAYEPEMVLIMLAHELGHFVGSKIRNREVRGIIAIKILAKLIVTYYQDSLLKWANEKDDGLERCYIKVTKFWDNIEKLILNKLEECCVNSGSVNWHSRDFKQCLYKSIRNNLVGKEYLKSFNYLYCNETYLQTLKNGIEHGMRESKILEQKVKEITNGLLFGEVFSDKKPYYNANINDILGAMFSFFKECIADVICILTLNVEMTDYFKALLFSNQHLAVDDELFLKSSVLLRMALVIDCMDAEVDDHGRVWNFEKEEECFSNEKEPLQSLKRNVARIYKWYFYAIGDKDERDEKIRQTSLPLNVTTLFFHDDIIDLYRKYLLDCRKTYYSFEKSFSAEEKRKEIANIYKQLKEDKNIENFLFEVTTLNKKYLENIYRNGEEMDGN